MQQSGRCNAGYPLTRLPIKKRHTRTSWLIQAGVPLSALQEMGGWESIEMVRRYAHLAPNHLTEHAKQIDAIFDSYVPNTSQGEKLASGDNH